jgi:thiol-disulfide isomerase/thioredoxin
MYPVTRAWLPAALGTAVALAALTGCAGTAAKNSSGAQDYNFSRGSAGDNGLFSVGDRHPAPAISGPSVTGTGTIDTGTMTGQVVVLNFWAEWCSPCRAEAPVLNEVYTRTKDAGVQFVGVSVKNDRHAAEVFERTHEVAYPSIFDQAAVQLTRFRKVVPQSPPSTLLIDRQGRVAGIFNGAVTLRQLQPAVEALAAEK